MQQNINIHQPWPTELADHTNLEKNRQQPGIINYLSNTNSSTSDSNDNINKNIDAVSKEVLSTERYSSTNSSVQDATDDLIQIQPVSIPHTTNMLDTNVTVDYNSQLFLTPRRRNHGATEISAQVLLRSDSLQYKLNNTTYMIGQ